MGTTTAAAEAYKIIHDGAASGVCMPVVATVPKEFSDEFKVRAVALLMQLHNATKAAEQIMREYPGTTIKGQTISGWAVGLRPRLVAGRRKGDPPTRFSPNKDAIIACHARGLTQAETVRELGIHRAVVSKHWPR